MDERIKRGEIWLFSFSRPNKRRPVLVLTRPEVIELLHTVLVAPVRVLRELQWEAEGGMPEWGDLLLVEGGTDRDRAVAAVVQPGQTARRVGV